MAKRIIVVFGLSVVAGQRHLEAFSQRLGNDPDVELTIVRSKEEFTPALVRAALAEKVNGFVISFRHPGNEACEPLALLADSTVPIVALSHCPEFDRRPHDVIAIVNDNREIGRLAASHLLATKRCASYAYLHDPFRSRWSADRFAGFSGELDANGQRCAELDSAEALLRLPKPIGVFANNDDAARSVLAFCRANGLSAPDEVLLVGVDNDEAVCCHCNPKLTSIEPDFEREGVLAAEQALAFLNRPAQARPEKRREIAVPPLRIVERASSANAEDSLAQRTLAFARGNALSDITVEDIAKRLRVSRRLLDLRFREQYATSIGETLIAIRLAEAKRLLEHTAIPIDDIAAKCGYRSASHLKALFRRHCGMTMGEFRNSGGQPAEPAI